MGQSIFLDKKQKITYVTNMMLRVKKSVSDLHQFKLTNNQV